MKSEWSYYRYAKGFMSTFECTTYIGNVSSILRYIIYTPSPLPLEYV